MLPARAHLESLLRTRRLDRTLTTSDSGQVPEVLTAATGVAVLDARLGGGFPRGHLSELIGRRSSGRMSVVLHAVAAATSRREQVALVDVLDMLDVESAVAAGIDLARVLWIRGHATASPGACRDMNQRAIEQALRALALVLQSGGFDLVVFDAGEAPADGLRRLPFTTWLRVQRMVEGSETACVLVGPEQMARSSAGVTIRLEARGSGLDTGERREAGGQGSQFRGQLFAGLDVRTRVIRARGRAEEDATLALATRASNCA